METCRFCNEQFDPNSIASGGLFGQCSKCVMTKQKMQVMMSYPVTTYRNESASSPLSIAKVSDDYFALNVKKDQEYLLVKLKSALGLGVSIGVRGEIGIDAESADLSALRMDSVSFLPPADFQVFNPCDFDFKALQYVYDLSRARDWPAMVTLASLLDADPKYYAEHVEQSDSTGACSDGAPESTDGCLQSVPGETGR